MSKGNLVVGQSGGATAVINQTLVGIIRQAQAEEKINRILGMRFGILGLIEKNFVDLTDMTEEQLLQLEQTPSAALCSCRYKLQDSENDTLLDAIEKNGINYFTLIGGNDSAETALHISKLAQARNIDLSAVALPKTIDNDLPCMDHTPGYGSVATFIGASTQEAGRDTEAMQQADPIKIIEVKGRNSGWTVASSALGKRSKFDAPHLIYFPERPFDEDTFVEDVTKVYKDIGYCVIVIAETLKDKTGRLVGERKEGITRDPFGHAYVDSAAACLCRLIEGKLGVRARYDKPGTLQNSSIRYISPVDQAEAQMCGKKAVSLAAGGKTDVIVTLERESDNPYKCTTGYVPIEKIAGIEKYMPENYINEAGNFITQDYIDYAKPLIGKIPEFIRL